MIRTGFWEAGAWGGFMMRTIIGCEPVSFFLRDVKPAMLHRGTGDELAGFIHFQHRDWITRPSCVASHAAATFSKNSSHSVSLLKSNSLNWRLDCFTIFCFQFMTWSLSSYMISMVHLPVSISSPSVEVTLLCLCAGPVLNVRLVGFKCFQQTVSLAASDWSHKWPLLSAESASVPLSSGGCFWPVIVKINVNKFWNKECGSCTMSTCLFFFEALQPQPHPALWPLEPESICLIDWL